jgi:hypothetical protein
MGDLRVGVVGLGWAAGAHIETFRLIFAADRSAKKREPVELSEIR